MTRRALTSLALAVGLLPVGVANADQAKPRGSGGGGSAGAGARHHSPSGGSSSRSTQVRDSGGSRGYTPAPSRPLTPAERRHPRAGTGHGYRPYYYYPGWGYWYYPGYYPGYYYGYWPYWGSGLYFGIGGYYGGGYYVYPYYPYGYHTRRYSDAGALRLLVEPEDTKVYVDGYYAGEVDDFDGLFQRLHVSPGRHEITLKRDGYRTHRIKVYVDEDSTVKIRHEMEKGAGPDTLEDLAGERGLHEERRRESRRYEDEAERDDEGRIAPPDAFPPGTAAEGGSSPGLLTLSVSPGDASVYVDGRFFGSAGQAGEIELRPGPHRVEVVRPGFRTVEREVLIESGRTQTVAIELPRP